ncbi:Fructose-2,6-bisphosphatase [Mucor velutinosus]|nr:Fructose-2,6-bisphosphatase [Mucor velutinosus]
MQDISSQAGASSCHDDKMERTDSHGDKMKDNSTTEGGDKMGSSGSAPKRISPFAFVEKQSKKPLSWQKFRGTDDSIHQNEDTVGPLATDSEDVEGPTSVSKGDNVIDMFDGLVPEAVLRHNANKRRVFKPTIPVRRQFRKKQKLTVVTDVSRNI